MVLTRHQAYLISWLCGLFAAYSASAQTPPPLNSCGTDQHTAKLLATDSTYRRFYKSLQLKVDKNTVDLTTQYTIPVVFLVFHLGEPVGTGGNLSDAVLLAALDTLNRNFAGQYPGEQYGVDTKIKFALAKRSASCLTTSGIIRVDASSVPTYQYGVNVNDITSQRQLEKLIPEYVNPVNDQFVVVRVFRDVSGAGAWSNYGGNIFIPVRAFTSDDQWTFTHEMGHSLSLAHTFGGSFYQNGTYTCPDTTSLYPEINSDLVDDTDPHRQDQPYYYNQCSTGLGSQFDQTINPCTGRPFGLIGRNFMSYSCERMFTRGQVVRMRAYTVARALANSPYLIAPNETDAIRTACIPMSVTAVRNHNDGINSVRFGQIDKDTGPGNTYGFGLNYYDFSCGHRSSLIAGQPYLLEVLGRGRHRKAYIDYNNDGAFDENTENILAVDGGPYSTEPETTTMAILIPTTAVINQYLRMRVIVDGGSTPPTACNLPGASYGSGEAEDYGVMIMADLSTCAQMRTVKAGNWNDPSIWSCGRLPTWTDSVEILHEVNLPAGPFHQANRLIYGPGGKLNLEAGARLLFEK